MPLNEGCLGITVKKPRREKALQDLSSAHSADISFILATKIEVFAAEGRGRSLVEASAKASAKASNFLCVLASKDNGEDPRFFFTLLEFEARLMQVRIVSQRVSESLRILSFRRS